MVRRPAPDPRHADPPRVKPRKGARILEVGCGTGHNLAMLGDFGTLDACELDALRGLASERLGRPVLEARLPDLSMFEGGVVRPHRAARRAGACARRPRRAGRDPRLLKPGGALLLTVPANRWMWSAHDVAHHHFRRYSRRGLAQLFAQARGTRSSCSAISTACCSRSIAAARIRSASWAEQCQRRRRSCPGAVTNAHLQRIFWLGSGAVGRVADAVRSRASSPSCAGRRTSAARTCRSARPARSACLPAAFSTSTTLAPGETRAGRRRARTA